MTTSAKSFQRFLIHPSAFIRCRHCLPTRRAVTSRRRKRRMKQNEGGSATKAYHLSTFSRLGRAHRGGYAFPFRRQAGKIMGQSGEIAIDRDGVTARCVSRWIFQRRG